VPIVRVGADLAEQAFRFLRTLPRLELEHGVRVVASRTTASNCATSTASAAASG
jgi:hypothetical protein